MKVLFIWTWCKLIFFVISPCSLQSLENVLCTILTQILTRKCQYLMCALSLIENFVSSFGTQKLYVPWWIILKGWCFFLDNYWIFLKIIIWRILNYFYLFFSPLNGSPEVWRMVKNRSPDASSDIAVSLGVFVFLSIVKIISGIQGCYFQKLLQGCLFWIAPHPLTTFVV